MMVGLAIGICIGVYFAQRFISIGKQLERDQREHLK